MINSFSFTPFPQIYFGEGEFLKLPARLSSINNALIITGGSSLKKSGMLGDFVEKISDEKIDYHVTSISGEPSPEMVDNIVDEYRDRSIDKVIAIGGGSVLDAGKAIAAMLPLNDSITNYLEGVGTKNHHGTTISFIAVPTTAGTGSEATKNAVISSVSEKGFKKSLRHDNFIPDMAVLDPQLMLSCPEPLTAACGLDAITQLLESYVSSAANPITDSLAFGALQRVIPSFANAVLKGLDDISARADMAYGALISGITLANAGLGIVHGFASPIGGFFDIPHGVVCGRLLPSATKINIKKLMESDLPEHQERLDKHIKVAKLFPKSDSLNDNEALENMINQFFEWVKFFNIPGLSHYGIQESDFSKIISSAGLKNNPVKLSSDNLHKILLESL